MEVPLRWGHAPRQVRVAKPLPPKAPKVVAELRSPRLDLVAVGQAAQACAGGGHGAEDDTTPTVLPACCSSRHGVKDFLRYTSTAPRHTRTLRGLEVRPMFKGAVPRHSFAGAKAFGDGTFAVSPANEPPSCTPSAKRRSGGEPTPADPATATAVQNASPGRPPASEPLALTPRRLLLNGAAWHESAAGGEGEAFSTASGRRVDTDGEWTPPRPPAPPHPPVPLDSHPRPLPRCSPADAASGRVDARGREGARTARNGARGNRAAPAAAVSGYALCGGDANQALARRCGNSNVSPRQAPSARGRERGAMSACAFTSAWDGDVDAVPRRLVTASAARSSTLLRQPGGGSAHEGEEAATSCGIRPQLPDQRQSTPPEQLLWPPRRPVTSVDSAEASGRTSRGHQARQHELSRPQSARTAGLSPRAGQRCTGSTIATTAALLSRAEAAPSGDAAVGRRDVDCTRLPAGPPEAMRWLWDAAAATHELPSDGGPTWSDVSDAVAAKAGPEGSRDSLADGTGQPPVDCGQARHLVESLQGALSAGPSEWWALPLLLKALSRHRSASVVLPAVRLLVAAYAVSPPDGRVALGRALRPTPALDLLVSLCSADGERARAAASRCTGPDLRCTSALLRAHPRMGGEPSLWPPLESPAPAGVLPHSLLPAWAAAVGSAGSAGEV